eukprot:GILI01002172.1.p1 GENE.GILI01002172.1~~GILI01002172.1.p1  ORF type:complete len:419 (+),score=154.25 GILI01002172.1:95-1351(+)
MRRSVLCALSLCVLVCLSGLVSAAKKQKPLFDATTSEVKILNSRNYDPQVKRLRDGQVSVVLFYDARQEESRELGNVFNKLGSDIKGVVQVAAIDCMEFYETCEKEKVEQFPTILVFPPNPMPIQTYEGEKTAQAIASFATRFLPSNVLPITTAIADSFVKDKPSMPKVILFTNKKATPAIFKALSTQFKGKLIFGEVRDSETDLVSKYKVTKFPTLLLLTVREPKPVVYKGEMKHSAIFDWLNIYSETFVTGEYINPNSFSQAAGSEDAGSYVPRPWLSQKVPELFKLSAEDVCFKAGGLCVVLLAKGKPSEDSMKLMEALSARYEQHISRGTKFNFMWLNVEGEAGYGKLFTHDGRDATPTLVVLNAGKRKRFASMKNYYESLDQDHAVMFLDRVLGGDAKFEPVKELPEFADRKE